MKTLSTIALLALAAAAPAYADCSYPRAPASIPDGATATKEALVETQKQVRQYKTEIEAYIACLQSEHDATIAQKGATLSEDQKKQMATLLDSRAAAAEQELATVAERFNMQVRAYNAAHPK